LPLVLQAYTWHNGFDEKFCICGGMLSQLSTVNWLPALLQVKHASASL
jgi:hypothetical protein